MEISEQFRKVETYIQELQQRICFGIENLDTTKFVQDVWKRPGGGGGLTCILQDGSVIEKGGVNISSVTGTMPADVASRLKTKEQEFAVCGISLVIHPTSPRIPTTHMNVRYFEMADGTAWFGGGLDLTPYYPHLEDFRFFHRTIKAACDVVDPAYYSQYKEECDRYFTITHRKEMRGVGGVFFDYLKNNDKHFRLIQEIGNSFLDAYLPIIKKRKEETYTTEDKQFQLIRRGRYVEFNLIYDRGTLFGLKTNGRIESILMSLPKEVNFLYDFKPAANSPHAEMTKYYQPFDYIA